MAVYFFITYSSFLDSPLKCLTLIIIFLTPNAITYQTASRDTLVVWDVGQGSWTSIVLKNHCLHIDMGGTIAKWPLYLTHSCSKKINLLALTHYDSDHISLIKRFSKNFETCLIHSLPSKIKQMPYLKFCHNHSPTNLHLQMLYSATLTYRNESNVYLWKKSLLITGDAPSKQEKLFINNPSIKEAQILLVGHHGSRTSSNPYLIGNLKQLKQAIVSANPTRYGHPHTEVKRRFKNLKIPLLQTAIFGTLIYEF